MKAIITKKHQLNQNWIDLLIKTYWVLTFTLGLYSFFHFSSSISNFIFFYEMAYLIFSLILVLQLLIRLNLFLIKIKRNNFRIPPIKFQIHSLNFWAMIIFVALIISYSLQSGMAIFGNLPFNRPTFLTPNLFFSLITTQFSLALYLLFSSIIIFIYALVLYQRKGLKIKIVPISFNELQNISFKNTSFFNENWKAKLFAFISFIESNLICSQPFLILLALKLNSLKALALRQFKKETTPPFLSIIN